MCVKEKENIIQTTCENISQKIFLVFSGIPYSYRCIIYKKERERQKEKFTLFLQLCDWAKQSLFYIRDFF